ncbi:MAG: electron transfer flavoprotein subunit beta/FixA family protein [Gaiellales bacterium]|nr:electron transfer flavoprotein subunit beta/FixA family protein [Gaiellales bacterium]
MKIIVPVKTNPDLQMIRIKNREPILEAVPYKVGDLDKNSVEAALQLQAAVGDTQVVALTIAEGNRKIKDTMKEVLAMGADEAYILSDDALTAADQAGKALALAKAIEKIGGADLIVFAEGSTDNYSGQMGPRVAELLALPEIGYAKKLTVADGKLTAERGMGDLIEVLESSLPAVVTVTSEINEPRIPTLMNIMKAGKKPTTEWTLGDVGLDAAAVAPQKAVLSNLAEEQQRKNVMIEGSAEEQCAALIDALIKDGVLEA